MVYGQAKSIETQGFLGNWNMNDTIARLEAIIQGSSPTQKISFLLLQT